MKYLIFLSFLVLSGCAKFEAIEGNFGSQVVSQLMTPLEAGFSPDPTCLEEYEGMVPGEDFMAQTILVGFSEDFVEIQDVQEMLIEKSLFASFINMESRIAVVPTLKNEEVNWACSLRDVDPDIETSEVNLLVEAF